MKKMLSPSLAIDSSDRRSFLKPGQTLQDRYRIIHRLGKGGMGAVYEAIDLRLDATVAVKETFAADDRLRRQFEQEARLLARLNHPALPHVTDYFTENEQAFIVMQFIAGADLAEIIATQPGPFPRQQVIAWADQLLDALVYLHSRARQIIHRDIKPHNLKLTSTGQIALLDFGLAKAEGAELSGADSTSIFGYTRRYSPLEQIRDQGTTPQSDIYALGATLYHLLTGTKPPDALTRVAALAESKADPLRPADEINRAVGPEIAGILLRAMAIHCEDRFQSASDFRDALRQVGREAVPVARTFAGTPVSKSASDVTVNTTVVRKPLPVAVDPFDGYSILKPSESDWPSPKPSRRPAAIVALLLVLMLAGAFASPYLFDFRTDPAAAVSDYATTRVGSTEAGKPVVPQTRLKPFSGVTASVKSEANRKSEKPKRPGRRSPSDPPAPSLRTALPLPADK
jgi:serine/threonine protein kinase